MKKTKFYVVWKGRQRGIFRSWEECAAQVSGYAGAEFKAFDSLDAAEAALHSRYELYRGKPTVTQGWLLAPSPPLLPSICVDAASSGSPGPVEWRGVDTESGRQLFHHGPYLDGTNNLGEFLAIVHALQWMEQHNCAMPVYSDSNVALLWVRAARRRTELQRTPKNAPLFTLIERAEAWLAEHPPRVPLLKWDTSAWGEIPADFGRK
ncbi:MAG: ribonuclease H [Anaerolineae bacterium]|nr:MAG: ribonuclease H [Anaerolineae bacterium]